MKDDALFAFARLWERWTIREDLTLKGSLAELVPGDVVETCTILTTTAYDAVGPVHDRMPVIVPREFFDLWLAGQSIALPVRVARVAHPAPSPPTGTCETAAETTSRASESCRGPQANAPSLQRATVSEPPARIDAPRAARRSNTRGETIAKRTRQPTK